MFNGKYFFLSLLLIPSALYAQTNSNCYVQAGMRYNIDPTLIYSIAEQESSFNPNAINGANRNGTADYGLMQINSFWLPTLKKFGAKKNHLFDPCYNIHIGSWILAQSFSKWGYTQNAIGAYNVGFEKTQVKDRLRKAYAEKIQSKYQKNCRLYGCSYNYRYDHRMYKQSGI